MRDPGNEVGLERDSNPWLHSSVGYRRGHGFESRSSRDFFFGKIYCDDHSSLSKLAVSNAVHSTSLNLSFCLASSSVT